MQLAVNIPIVPQTSGVNKHPVSSANKCGVKPIMPIAMGTRLIAVDRYFVRVYRVMAEYATMVI